VPALAELDLEALVRDELRTPERLNESTVLPHPIKVASGRR
jgi:hypothetical protein